MYSVEIYSRVLGAWMRQVIHPVSIRLLQDTSGIDSRPTG